MDFKFKGGYSRMTGCTTGNNPEYDRGFRNGQQSKQAEIEHRTQVSAELAGELIRKRAEIDALNSKVDKIREVIEEQYGELDYWADVAFDHVIEELDK